MQIPMIEYMATVTGSRGRAECPSPRGLPQFWQKLASGALAEWQEGQIADDVGCRFVEACSAWRFPLPEVFFRDNVGLTREIGGNGSELVWLPVYTQSACRCLHVWLADRSGGDPYEADGRVDETNSEWEEPGG